MEDESLPEQNKKQQGFFKLKPNQKYDESSSNALLGLFLFSALMFTLPLMVLFFSRNFLDDYFQLEPPYSQLAPAILAIITVNIIIVAYIIKAFRENAKETPVDTRTMEERKKLE